MCMNLTYYAVGAVAAGLVLVNVHSALNVYFAVLALIGVAIIVLEVLQRLHINGPYSVAIVAVVALVLAALTSAAVGLVAKAAPK